MITQLFLQVYERVALALTHWGKRLLILQLLLTIIIHPHSQFISMQLWKMIRQNVECILRESLASASILCLFHPNCMWSWFILLSPFRDASDTNRIRRQFDVQSVRVSVCQFLLLDLLHCFLQGKVRSCSSLFYCTCTNQWDKVIWYFPFAKDEMVTIYPKASGNLRVGECHCLLAIDAKCVGWPNGLISVLESSMGREIRLGSDELI